MFAQRLMPACLLVFLMSLTGVVRAQQSGAASAPPPAPAPNAPQAPAQQEEVLDAFGQPIRTTVNVVVAPTVVIDRDGKYVTGLSAADFELYDNNKLQSIRVDEAYNPISLVVLIQADKNAHFYLPRIKKISSMLQPLIVGEAGEVAIASFDHRFQLQTDFTQDQAKLDEAVRKIREGSSSSALTDAVTNAVRMLSKRPSDHRRVILLIAENRDRGSGARIREALSYAQIHNVLIYTVNLNRFVTNMTKTVEPPRPSPIPPEARSLPAGVPATPTTVAAMKGGPAGGADFVPVFVEIFRQVKSIFIDNHAEVLTKFTGGREYGFTTEKDLHRAISAIGEELHSQYLISFSPNNRLEGGWHDIRVVVNRSNVTVKTRPGYWMAAVPY